MSQGVEPGEQAYHILLHSYATPNTAKEFHAVRNHYLTMTSWFTGCCGVWQMVRSLQTRGLVLRPSIHKQMLELAAELGDPVKAGLAVSAIRRSGQRLSGIAYSQYIIANAKSRVGLSLPGLRASQTEPLSLCRGLEQR